MPTVKNGTDPVARRGSKWITEEQLRGHLASLLRLPNVGFLLGAGTSCGALGGKTVSQIWKGFSTEQPAALKWLVDEKFLRQETDDVDIEELIAALDLARVEWARLGRPRKVSQLDSARAGLMRALVAGSALLRERWTGGGGIEPLAAHCQLLQKVLGSREPGQSPPWFFSTNFDLALEWAAEASGVEVFNGFEGYHERTFNPARFDLGLRSMVARGEARFGSFNIYLVKLHGSLNWGAANSEVVEKPAFSVWPEIDAFLSGESEYSPGMLVMPHTGKYLSTVGFVLGEMFRRLAEFTARPHACLIVSGYSFADLHLNRLLFAALQNPTLQVVVFLPELTRVGDVLHVVEKPKSLKSVLSRAPHQVCFVGGGADAYFDRMIDRLPEPATLDHQQLEIDRILRRLAFPAADGGAAE